MKKTLIATACLLLAAGSHAQQSEEKNNSEQPQTLDKVIVTAQKREQALIDVPSSVTAVRAESLASAGLVRLEDYAAEVPGMSITAL